MEKPEGHGRDMETDMGTRGHEDTIGQGDRGMDMGMLWECYGDMWTGGQKDMGTA